MGKFTGNPNQFDGKNQFVSCKLSLKPIHFNMAFSSFSGRGKPIAFSVAAATFPAARQGAWREWHGFAQRWFYKTPGTGEKRVRYLGKL